MLPYVILKFAMSIDAYIDADGSDRLLLSSPEDFARVDEVRATCDAILVGAGTVRRDNPSLILRSEELRRQRIKNDKPPDPTKVTITSSGNLDRRNSFFTTGTAARIVYATSAASERLNVDDLATVVALPGDLVDLRMILDDLSARGVNRLLVEGGTVLGTALLEANLISELHISIAPFLLGQHGRAPLVSRAKFPFGPTKRMTLQLAERIGDMGLLVYRLE